MRAIIGWTSKSTVTGPTAGRDRSAGQRRTGGIVAAAVTALLASTLVPGAMAPASAAVLSAPPAANGFPASYDDGNVKLGLGPLEDGEGFYFNASATGGKLEVYEAALEATYLNDAVVAGEEIVFSRLRFRVTGLDAGQTYTITHPYGVDSFVAVAGARSINATVDVGCESVPCDFNLAGAAFLGDHTANADFLKQVGAPVGTVGDPNVARPVTGAPSGTNAVIISGPNAGGPGINTLTVRDFAVQGQIVAVPPTVPPVTVPPTVPPVTVPPTVPPVTIPPVTVPPTTPPTVPPVTIPPVTIPPVTVPPTTPPTAPSAARISRVAPPQGAVGARVTIMGTGFGQAGVVKFGSVASPALSWTDTRIVVRVSGEDFPHRVLVTVTPTNRAASNGVSFRIVTRP